MVINAWAIAISGFVFTKQFEITNWKWGHLHTVYNSGKKSFNKCDYILMKTSKLTYNQTKQKYVTSL